MGVISFIKTMWNGGSPAAETDAAYREAAGSTVHPDEDMTGWRKLSGQSDRDLSPITHDRMQELAVYLWRTNPLANRMVELPTAYLTAEGVSLTVPDEEAQKWLDAFWNDPVSRWPIRLDKKIREMALFGEQCWPVFKGPTGHVRVGYLDPARIERVVTDPDNAEQPIGVVTKKDAEGNQKRYSVIVNGPETVFSRDTQRLRMTFDDGDCFYFNINALSTASRGASDLLAVMDWLDALDQALYGELERWDAMRAFLWDVTLKGATEDEVKRKAEELTVPESGGVRVHNDAEEWSAVAPDIKPYEANAAARLFRNHILGGATVPEHWYGSGGDVNRATASEMGDPTYKVYSAKQRYWTYILMEVGQYAVNSRLKSTLGASAVDPLDPDPDYAVAVEWPEMVVSDTSAYATALQQTVTAMATAVDRGLVSRGTAVRIISAVAGRLGVEVDAADELDAVEEESIRAMEDDLAAAPPMSGPEPEAI